MEYVRELLTDMCVISPFKIFEYTDDDHEEFVIKSINDINHKDIIKVLEMRLKKTIHKSSIKAKTPIWTSRTSYILRCHIK